MSHKRAIAVVVVILALIAIALISFGTWAVMNGVTGSGYDTGLSGVVGLPAGQRDAATKSFE